MSQLANQDATYPGMSWELKLYLTPVQNGSFLVPSYRFHTADLVSVHARESRSNASFLEGHRSRSLGRRPHRPNTLKTSVPILSHWELGLQHMSVR